MIFSKSTDPMCCYCEKGILMQNTKYVICKKKGIVSSSGQCRSYIYDPLKRTPVRHKVRQNEYEQKDFEIV